MNLQDFFHHSKSYFLSFFSKLEKDDVFLFAGALSFNTIVCAIPLLGLIFSLAKALIPENTIIIKSFEFLAKLLPSEVAGFVVENLIYFLDRIKNFPLGKFSLFTYFTMSIGLLFLLESCLNRIFLSPKKRSLQERISFFWLTLTLAPFLLLLPFLLHTFLSPKLRSAYLLIFPFITLLFYLLFTYFPLRKIPKKYTLLSAVITTFIWWLTSISFSWYVKHAISYSAIYGSLSTIFFFFLWLYLNWITLLVGAELTSFLTLKDAFLTSQIPCTWDRLKLLYYLWENFALGNQATMVDLEKKLQISPERFYQLLTELEKEGLVIFIEEQILPAKDLSTLSLAEILKFPENILEEEKVKPIAQLKESLSGIKLSDLIKRDTREE